MKLKLIALAAFAVCGSSAFAGCTTPSTSSDELVMSCAPQVTVYMAGASAQAPAVHQLLLTTSTVFDLTKAIAIVTPHTGLNSTKYYGSRTSSSLSDSSVTTSAASSTLAGAKATVIYLGTGAGTYNATTNPNGGRRIAVVYNTSNGSFAGVKQMTEAVGTTNPSTSALNGDEHSQGLLTSAQQTAAATLTCVKTGSTNSTGTAAVWSYNSGTPIIPSYACTGNASTTTYNYLVTAPAGGTTGVQLALADVAPRQASLGVLTAGAWTPSKYPLTVTGVQGFGIMVNDLALKALIKREVAAGRLPSTCDYTTIASNVTTSTLTGKCQPSIRSSDMNALVRGTATAALISGDDSDTTAIAYYRRVPFSGTQAASNIMFAGQAATEGFVASAVVAGTAVPTGYTAPIGTSTTSTPAATIDSSGNYSYTSTSGLYKNYAKVGSKDVISGVSGNTTQYAFGVVSLEKVWNATKASSDLKGASWVKLDGISPNYYFTSSDSTGTHDTNQRKGMQAGYPFQFEMVAMKNPSNPFQKAVVDNIVTGLMTASYNLPGIAYIGSTDSTYKAKFYRGGSANNYAPLTKYDTTAY